MLPSNVITVGTQLEVTEEIGLWDHAAYTARTGIQWRGEYPESELPAALPPMTQASELLVMLSPGTIITVRKPPGDNASLSAGILYHAARTTAQNLAYQCLYVEVSIAGAIKVGLAWTTYESVSKIVAVSTQAPVSRDMEVRDNSTTYARVGIDVSKPAITRLDWRYEQNPTDYGSPLTKFIEEPGRYDVIGDLGAYEDYSAPKPVKAPDGSEYLGGSKNLIHALKQGDIIDITKVDVYRVTNSYETHKAYQVVQGKIVRRGGKDVSTDAKSYYFWVVYEGVHKVSPLIGWSLPADKATYRARAGNLVTFYNDASEGPDGTAGAFADLEGAINSATDFVFIAGWSVHPLMRLRPKGELLGEMLVNWARKNQKGLVAIHVWNHTDAVAPDPQSDAGETILTKIAGGKMPENLLWKLSSRSGIGWTHHQKFVVMDGPAKGQLRVFLGGLDLSKGRFDWPAHLILPRDNGDARLEFFRSFRKHPSWDSKVNEWYNPEFGYIDTDKLVFFDQEGKLTVHPRQPWHDVHCRIIGPAAYDAVCEFVGRWPEPTQMSKKFCSITKGFRGNSEEKRGEWNVQIYRSMQKDGWKYDTKDECEKDEAGQDIAKQAITWRLGQAEYEKSVQDAHIQGIEKAEHFIYIETQFFTGSGNRWPKRQMAGLSNRIPEMLIEKVKGKHKANQKFHIYMIMPMYPEGNPVAHATNQVVRDFQWRTIQYVVSSIATFAPEWGRYLTMGFLANWEALPGAPRTNAGRLQKLTGNRRHMVYVHSKMMIVDDRYIIIGTANLNQRSLGGDRDTEICAGIWSDGVGHADGIRKFRYRLWKEHFGAEQEYWRNPGEEECVSQIRRVGADNYQLLKIGKTSAGERSKRGSFCAWPINVPTEANFWTEGDKKILDFDEGFLPSGNDWDMWPFVNVEYDTAG